MSNPDITARLSQRWQWGSKQAISFLMQQAVENRDVISLAAGLVDEVTLPVSECRSALSGLFSDDARARHALQYGTTGGADVLRHTFDVVRGAVICQRAGSGIIHGE